MACLECLEKRKRWLEAVGLGRFAPDIPGVTTAPVAHVQPDLAAHEFDLPPKIQRLFQRYLLMSDEGTVATITQAAACLISFALANACEEKKCAEEQIEMVRMTIQAFIDKRYDPQSGKRREIVVAKP